MTILMSQWTNFVLAGMLLVNTMVLIAMALQPENRITYGATLLFVDVATILCLIWTIWGYLVTFIMAILIFIGLVTWYIGWKIYQNQQK